MTKMGSYLKRADVGELRGRLNFVSKPLAVHLEKIKDPKEPVLRDLYTANDERCLENYGIDAGAFNIMMEEIHAMAMHDEVIKGKVKELLTLMRLQGSDSLEAQLEHHKRKVEKRRQGLLAQDRQYQGAIKSAESRRKNLTHNWEETASHARTRWRRILKSIRSLLQREEFFSNLAEPDQWLLEYLAKNTDYVVIEADRVTKFDFDMLVYIEFHQLLFITDQLLKGEVQVA